MPNFTFENLLKLILPVFILLGLTQVTSYYSVFNIPILDYLDFTEILTIFLSNFFNYLFMMVPLMVIFFSVNQPTLKRAIALSIIAVIFICFIVFINTDFKSVQWGLISAMTIPILLQVIRSLSVFRSELPNITRSNNIWALSVLFILAMILITGIMAMKEAKSVKENHLYLGTTITLNNFTRISDSTSYYIGKTNNYIFFYNQKDSTTDIYPSSQVQHILYKMNYSSETDTVRSLRRGLHVGQAPPH